MSEDPLLERANRVIAESGRLIDDLRRSMWKAQRLDEGLRDLHERRLEEESRNGLAGTALDPSADVSSTSASGIKAHRL